MRAPFCKGLPSEPAESIGGRERIFGPPPRARVLPVDISPAKSIARWQILFSLFRAPLTVNLLGEAAKISPAVCPRPKPRGFLFKFSRAHTKRQVLAKKHPLCAKRAQNAHDNYQAVGARLSFLSIASAEAHLLVCFNLLGAFFFIFFRASEGPYCVALRLDCSQVGRKFECLHSGLRGFCRASRLIWMGLEIWKSLLW